MSRQNENAPALQPNGQSNGDSERHPAELTATFSTRGEAAKEEMSQQLQQPNATAGFGSAILPKPSSVHQQLSSCSSVLDGAIGIDLGLPPIPLQPEQSEVAAAAAAAAAAPGRIYHDENFNTGHLVPSGTLGASGALNTYGLSEFVKKDTIKELPIRTPRASNLGNATTTSEPLRFQFTQGGSAVPVSFATPMPKWPAGHQSAAFDAIGEKKSLILSPAEIYAECAHHGEEKSKFPWYKIWILSIIAGCYVGFGYSTCLYVGGNLSFAPAVVKAHGSGEVNVGLFKLLFGAFGFPFGFTTIVVCGGELFTSLCAYMTAAWFEKKVSAVDVIRMLTISWIGNFLGCAALAGMYRATEVFEHYDYTLKAIALDKVSHSWGATFVKGIFANWLVGMATWMANAAQDLTGKFVGIWLPISAFAALGFEHCIANQFLFVLAWAQGADISAKEFIWNNLIPSTLGNYIGGGFFLGATYAFCFGGTPRRAGMYYDHNIAPKMPWAKKRE